MIFDIPITPGVPAFEFEIALEGTRYILKFDWNGRVQRFFWSIMTVDRDPILSNRKLLANVLLWRQSADSRTPPGQMICTNYREVYDDEQPTLATFGDRFKLRYVTSDEYQ